MTYDAVLVLSFGGPEGPDDVVPFLRNVTKGRNVPEERLATVAEQYRQVGGRSPINDQCRTLIAALEADLAANDIDLPVYWGNRNWSPFVAETVQAMAADGVTNALVFVTSAFGSYSGCRQYREDLQRARDEVGAGAPQLTKLRLFYNHPGFVEPLAEYLATTIEGCSGGASARVVFTAHSLPTSMALTCQYVEQLQEAARLVMRAAGLKNRHHDVVYQSRSGPPSVPWLEPDINDHLEALSLSGAGTVIVVPLGFISDHMEVLFDLDTQAKDTADRLGLELVRVPTVGVDRRFVSMVRRLIEERLNDGPRLWLGGQGAWPDTCPTDHCLPPAGSGRPAGPAPGPDND